MSEEFIDERERDLLDYLRNNATDPESRGTDITETFTTTEGQTTFTLANTLVKNVADSITLDSSTLHKGYNFTVSYGEGHENTVVTLLSPATAGQSLSITYHYGSSMIEREFSRTDVLLPRVVMKFLLGDEDYSGLGDIMEEGLGSYINVSFRLEIRDVYANRARQTASQIFNLFRKLRHANLFRTNITRAGSLQNFDFDPDKNCYVWQFTADVQWEVLFE